MPARYCSTLSGLAASTSSTTASMAATSDTCPHAARLHDRLGIDVLVDNRRAPLALLGGDDPSAIIFTSAQARAGVNAQAPRSNDSSAFMRAAKSLMMRLATGFREPRGVVARRVHARLEEVRRHAMLHQMTRIVSGEPEAARETRGFLIGQLGQPLAHALDELVGQVVGRQVGFGEQAVVVSRLLHTHDDGALGGRIPVARLLVDDAALLEHLGLTADLVGKAVVQALERVEVLELGLHAELLRSAPTQAHVAVAAQRPLLHRAVRDADGQVDLTQLLHEQARFLGRAQVGLSHELDERRARADAGSRSWWRGRP